MASEQGPMSARVKALIGSIVVIRTVLAGPAPDAEKLALIGEVMSNLDEQMRLGSQENDHE